MSKEHPTDLERRLYQLAGIHLKAEAKEPTPAAENKKTALTEEERIAKSILGFNPYLREDK